MILTHFSSKISWEGRKKFLAPYSSLWKIEIFEKFSKIMKNRQKLVTLKCWANCTWCPHILFLLQLDDFDPFVLRNSSRGSQKISAVFWQFLKNHNIWNLSWCIKFSYMFRYCDFSKIVKKQQKFSVTLSSYFWAQMGQNHRVVAKKSMRGHQLQFAQHLNVANFRRFFMIFENFSNISIFQSELWGPRNFLRPSQDISELK